LETPTDVTHPPTENIRWAAQFEFMSGCLIAWPVMRRDYDTVFCHIVDEIQDVGFVFMLYRNAIERDTIIQVLLRQGVPLDSLIWLNVQYDTWWTRDYGPQNIFYVNTGIRAIVDNYCIYGLQDNAVNNRLAQIWGTDLYSTPMFCEGGNLLNDGMGRVFCTEEILWENHLAQLLAPHFQQPMGLNENGVRQVFQDYLNVDLVIFPEPPISPHLDMSAKLVDPETWIIGQWPPDDPNTPVIDQIIDILDTMVAPTGNPYTIYRVQQPPRLPNGYWRTYTNSYLQNGKILVAIYGTEEDSSALAVFQTALPDYEVVGINCCAMDNSGGAIHCSTHEISESEALREFIESSVELEDAEFSKISSPLVRTSINSDANITINFTISHTSTVKLDIYNILGRKVSSLKNEVLSAGEYCVVWNGDHQVSGIYFLNLKADSYSETRKIVLVK
jgi:agmatine/peptidylarginine deiminase